MSDLVTRDEINYEGMAALKAALTERTRMAALSRPECANVLAETLVDYIISNAPSGQGHAAAKIAVEIVAHYGAYTISKHMGDAESSA